MIQQCRYQDAIAYYEALEPTEAREEIYQQLNTCYKILGNHHKADYYRQKINLLKHQCNNTSKEN